MTARPLAIRRGPFDLAGVLHLPADLDPARRHAAVVISTPGSSVKEQIGATYGSRLAERGLVVLTFDPGHQGQSGGEPRDLEDPYARSDDISFALDTLAAQDLVDEQAIGVLGVCAGGGYAVHAARTDHRIRAVGTVVPVNIGRARRQGLAGEGVAAGLDRLAQVRAREVLDDELIRVPWLPDTLEDARAAGITDVDTLQAITYYRTPRGRSEHSTNRRLARSDALMIGFDAFHLVEELLTQPLQVVLGGRVGSTGSFADGMQLWEAAPHAADLLVVEGAGHYEMYDEPAYVEQAVDRLAAFYHRHLGPAS
jgi:fermentation-respiration switch protein FrsA (DUF1100 family)